MGSETIIQLGVHRGTMYWQVSQLNYHNLVRETTNIMY